MELAYIPVTQGFYEIPLGRYLPSAPRGIIGEWLAKNTAPGSLVADPLGASPMTAIEAARASRCILFARNNPILWLLTETIAAAPSKACIRNLVSKLLLVRFSGETLDNHLRSLYESECSSCGKSLQPEFIIWERDSVQPISKVYTCPACGDSGEKTVSDNDTLRLKSIGDYRLHSIRALRKVTSESDGVTRERLSRALDCYLPRGLYVCMMLVNAIDSLHLEKKERIVLQTILLSVFDDANALWPWPERDYKPTLLNKPEKFMEKNLWLSLDRLDSKWPEAGEAVEVTYWPKLPKNNIGICMYHRRLANLKSIYKSNPPEATITCFPKPNQAFWTLSALWSGWIWGEKATLPMRNAMLRSKFDWLWYSNAIIYAFKPFQNQTDKTKLLFGLMPYTATNLFFGASVGIYICGYKKFSCASRKEDGLMQCEWQSGAEDKNFGNQISDLLKSFFVTYGQPAELPELILYCLANLNRTSTIPESINEIEIDRFGKIQDQIIRTAKDENLYQQFKSEQTGATQWFPISGDYPDLSFLEQIEKRTLELISSKENYNQVNLDENLCKDFPGFIAPPSVYIQLLKGTYAHISDIYRKNSGFNIDSTTDDRLKAVQDIQLLLHQCADKMGLMCTFDNIKVTWKNLEGVLEKVFWVVNDFTTLTSILCKADQTNANNLVFPAGHSRLLLFRIKSDLRIDQLLSNGWHLIKYRTVLRLSQQQGLNLRLWNEIMTSDPPQWDTPFQTQLI